MSAGPDDEHVDATAPSGEDDHDDEREQPIDGNEEEWEFSLEEVGDEDERSGNVTGTMAGRGPLEAGDIDLENAVFFLVGALGTILFVVLAIAGL